MDDLPTEYDTIVIGTGMTGSIIAAALSRIGKAVLHLDENDYYGEEWASFNLESLNILLDTKLINSEYNFNDNGLIEPGEKFVPASRRPRIHEITQKWHCPESTVAKTETDNSQCLLENVEEQAEQDVNLNKGGAIISDEIIESNNTTDIQRETWTQDRLKREYRKFNFDISPKMLYSRGPLVELLISSNIARYAEFKSVNRVLTWRDGRLEVVPCSRADVFATKHVNVVQKRMLVKVLTVLSEYPECTTEFEGFENKTFLEYLRHKKLSEQVIHYILYAIAMGDDKTACIDGVVSCQRFLKSLGRYGNTPFIFPLYGSGELPQCFCRLCAVFGGVYHLKRAIDGYVISPENEIVAIISGGQRLKTKQIVISSACCPEVFLQSANNSFLTRGIFITDRSLVETEKEAVTLLQFPPGDKVDKPVTVMEMGGSCQVCPNGLFMVHMTTEADNGLNALETTQQALFSDAGPSVLWSLTLKLTSGNNLLTPGSPSNLKVFTGPDAGLDFDSEIQQAQQIFLELCPTEEFLPRAPDPDEIVMDFEPSANENKEEGEEEKTTADIDQSASEVHNDDLENETTSHTVDKSDMSQV